MQDVIQSIAQKVGISEEQAKVAFETTISAVKAKMPESISSQMDNLLAGKDFDFKVVIGEKFSDLKEDAAETFEDLKEDAAEKFDQLKEGFKKMF